MRRRPRSLFRTPTDSLTLGDSPSRVVSHLVMDFRLRWFAVVAMLTIVPLVVQLGVGDLLGAATSALVEILTIVIGWKALHARVEAR